MISTVYKHFTDYTQIVAGRLLEAIISYSTLGSDIFITLKGDIQNVNELFKIVDRYFACATDPRGRLLEANTCYSMLCLHLLINLKDNIFDTAVGTSPNLARMCG